MCLTRQNLLVYIGTAAIVLSVAAVLTQNDENEFECPISFISQKQRSGSIKQIYMLTKCDTVE